MSDSQSQGSVSRDDDDDVVRDFQVRLYQATIFATPIIFGAMLVVLLCLLYVKRRRGSMVDHIRGQGRLQQNQMLRGSLSQHEEGLSKSFREKLPVVLYDDKAPPPGFQDSQCVVCLSDFLVDEKVKQLPACNHSFHAHCIDEWLGKHATCPICRTTLAKEEISIAMGLWSARNGERLVWEDRVVNGVPSQASFTRIDMLNTTSTRGSTPSSEVTLDMDRS